MLRRLSLILAVSAVLGGSALVASVSAAGARIIAARAAPASGLTAAIIGGSTAQPGSFPWLAFVTMDDDRFQCSGTVISPDLVLTAGHCVYDTATGKMFRPGRMHVTTGTLDWTGGGQVAGVQRTMAAPGYDPITGDRDAAIIQLARPTRAPAVALATQYDSSLQTGGSPVVIAGWGLTDAGDQSSQPAALQWAPTVVRSRGWCARRWAPFDGANELCTIDSPQDTTSFCNGDSGGPVIADEFSGQSGEPTEIGVIDDSQSCATDAPDFSARVAAISDWAREAIAQYPARGSVRAKRKR